MSAETCCKIKSTLFISVLIIAALVTTQAQQVQQNVHFNTISPGASGSFTQERLEPRTNLTAMPMGVMTANPYPQEQAKYVHFNTSGSPGASVSFTQEHFETGTNLTAMPMGVTTANPYDRTATVRFLREEGEVFDKISRRNVKLSFLLSALNALVMGISQGAVFDKYLFAMSGGSNTVVGNVGMVSGLANVLAAVPVGLLVDSRPGSRAGLCKISSFLGLLAAVGMILAVRFDNLALIFVSMFVRTVFSSLSGSVTNALFTDSVPKGTRQRFFTRRAMIMTAAACLGQAFTAAGFYAMGNTWNTSDMKIVNIVGNSILPFVCLTLMFFKDLPVAESKQDNEMSIWSQLKSLCSLQVGARMARDVESNAQKLRGVVQPWHVPWVLAFSNFIRFFGTGLTIRFFSLWWINDQHFSGALISWLHTASPVVMAFFMPVTQILAKRLGRAQTSILIASVAIPLLVGLATLRTVAVLVVMYLVRWALIHALIPIQQSILADFTPSSQRGQWNTLWSLVSSIPMAFSAFVGGKLADSHDYRFLFLISAGIQLVGVFLYAPLLMAVPRKEGAKMSSKAAGGNGGK